MVRKLIPTSLFLLTVSAAAAFAGGPTVTYGDLNIARPADAATLEKRITAAAAAYCAPTYEARHLIAPAFASAASTACIRQVSHNTLTEIQSKAVSPQLALR